MYQEFLFKYVPFNAPSLNHSHTLQIKRQKCFEKGEIWFPQATKLNDPFECNPHLLFDFNEIELEKVVNSLTNGELKVFESKIGISKKEELLTLLKTPNVMNYAGFDERRNSK